MPRRGQWSRTRKTKPRSSLLAIETLLYQTESARRRIVVQREAAWRTLAAEVGAEIPPPASFSPLGDEPALDHESVLQTTLNSNVKLGIAYHAHRAAKLAFRQADEAPFTKGRKEAALAARAEMFRAQWRMQETHQSLTQQVAEAFGRYEAARRGIASYDEQILPNLRERARLVQRQYELGAAGGSDVELLSARQALRDALVGRAETRLSLWQAVADLLHLMQQEM